MKPKNIEHKMDAADRAGEELFMFIVDVGGLRPVTVARTAKTRELALADIEYYIGPEFCVKEVVVGRNAWEVRSQSEVDEIDDDNIIWLDEELS